MIQDDIFNPRCMYEVGVQYNNMGLLLYYSGKRKGRERSRITPIGKHDEVIITLMCLIMLCERIPSPPLLDKFKDRLLNHNHHRYLHKRLWQSYISIQDFILILTHGACMRVR